MMFGTFYLISVLFLTQVYPNQGQWKQSAGQWWKYRLPDIEGNGQWRKRLQESLLSPITFNQINTSNMNITQLNAKLSLACFNDTKTYLDSLHLSEEWAVKSEYSL